MSYVVILINEFPNHLFLYLYSGWLQAPFTRLNLACSKILLKFERDFCLQSACKEAWTCVYTDVCNMCDNLSIINAKPIELGTYAECNRQNICDGTR
jgi:hypothetical protein